MKKRCFALVFVLLLFTSAWAEFDFSPYTYKSNPDLRNAAGLPLSGNRVLITEYGQDMDTFLFYEGQTLLKSVQFPADSLFRQPFVLPDGRAGVFLCSAHLPRIIQAVQFFDAQGSLEAPIPLTSFLNSTQFLDSQWISTQKVDDLLYLSFCDEQGKLDVAFPFGQTNAQPEHLACISMQDGSILAAVCLSESGTASPLLLKKISPSRHLSWELSLPAPGLSGYHIQLIETPSGGIIVSCISGQNAAQLYGLNASGDRLWEKTISRPGSMLHLTDSQPTPDGARFYGFLREGSTYSALSLEVSIGGELSLSGAKDLSALPEKDALSVRLAPDGRAVVSSSYHEYAGSVSQVFVPFDVLPEAPEPVLTLQ